MSKHTPGPWTVGVANIGKHPIGIHSIGAYGYVLADVHCDVPEVARHCEGNARLIAASPDLLSIAMRWAALDGGAWNVDRHAMEMKKLLEDTVAAIAKATGADAIESSMERASS